MGFQDFQARRGATAVYIAPLSPSGTALHSTPSPARLREQGHDDEGLASDIPEFLHRAIRLLYRGVGVRTYAGVGVRDRDTAMPLPADEPWRLLFDRPFGFL